jgi:hypothetical protein
MMWRVGLVKAGAGSENGCGTIRAMPAIVHYSVPPAVIGYSPIGTLNS